MEIIPKYFPENETANNNAAAVLIQNGELATAGRYLEKAGDGGITQNNRGIIYLLDGDMKKAETYFTKAQSLDCEEASANLQELQAKREDNSKMERYQNRK